MPSLTIALVGDPSDPTAGQQGAEITGDGQPYRELPKAILEANREDHLLDVLSKASREFGVSFPQGRETPPSWIAFYRPEDDKGYSPRRESTGLQLLSGDGHLTWIGWWHDPVVTVGALIDSADAGALDGDAYKPYLILRPGYGNGILPTWAEFLLMVVALRDTLGIIADAQGSVQAAKSVGAWATRLLRRIRGVPEVVDKNAAHWSDYGGSPANFTALVDRQPWDSGVLASLLGTTQPEAETLLAGRGFTLNRNSGLWQLGDGEEDRIVRRVVQRAMWFDWESDYSSTEGRERLRVEITDTLNEAVAEETESDEA